MANEWPALKLLHAPTQAFAAGRPVPIGGLIPLGPGLTLGTEGDVRVAAAIEKRHCRVEPKNGAIRLWHYVSLNRTSVNGQPRLDATLQHRDLISLTGGTLFRFLERDDVVATDTALERDIDEHPEADDRLMVWADFLLEHGDPLGERIASASRNEELTHAPWLETFAGHFVSGRLDVTWHLGLGRAVAMRELTVAFSSVADALSKLFALRVMRLLRQVRLDYASERVFDPLGVDRLASVRWPAAMQRLHLGDVPETDWPTIERGRHKLSRAIGRPVEVGVFRDAVLEVKSAGPSAMYRVGERAEIGHQLVLGERGASPFTGLATAGTYVIRRADHRFVLEQLTGTAESVMRVNGQPVQRFPLRDGDDIELGDDFVARFALRRP